MIATRARCCYSSCVPHAPSSISLSFSALFCAPGARPQTASPCLLASWRWVGFASGRHWQEVGRQEERELAMSLLCSLSVPACVSGSSCVSWLHSLGSQPFLHYWLILGSRKTISFPCSVALRWCWLPACQRTDSSPALICFLSHDPLVHLRSSLLSLLCLHTT